MKRIKERGKIKIKLPASCLLPPFSPPPPPHPYSPKTNIKLPIDNNNNNNELIFRIITKPEVIKSIYILFYSRFYLFFLSTYIYIYMRYL